MNVLVAGATGKTGIRIIHELKNNGHTPLALVRESSNAEALPSDIDLRHGDLTDLHDGICEGCDAVIFAAGSGGSTGDEMTDKVDRDGAISLIDHAKKANVSHFVMLSTVGAEEPNPNSELAHYLQAKHEADEHLKKSDLSYTILRPVSLTDDAGVRDMRFGDEVDPKGKAARGDVAAVLANAIDDPEWWLGKITLMQSARLT